jgi:diguanylate cyclase (GGDEF)-like protein
MTHRKTTIIQTPIGHDQGLEKNHASLIVLTGAEIGRDFRLRGGSTVIGRDTSAKICLPDDRASRQHARVDCQDAEGGRGPTFTITDLGSTNRTFVNSKPVESVELRDGDKIQIGGTVLKFVFLDDIEARFHSEVRDRISYDQLTGLLTKESLYLAFQRELERCLRFGLPLGVLMMDLDRFKSVNDTHGHLMGSHVLAEVGGLISHSVRISDVSARYGGEEFVTYLAETDLAGAETVAERIRSGIEAHVFTLDDVSIPVTISIGVSVAPSHGESIDALVAAADQAMYRAKETGRNRVCLA